MSRQLTSGVLGRKKKEGIRPNYFYGLMYNWWAASDERICNSGFSISSDIEFLNMTNYVNSNYNISPNDFGLAYHLRSCRQVNSPLGGDCNTDIHPRWDNTNVYGRDTVKLGIIPGSQRTAIGFATIGTTAYIHTSTSFSENDSLTRRFDLSSGTVWRVARSKKLGFSLKACRPAIGDEMLISEGIIIANYYIGNNGFLYDCVRIDDRIWITQNLAETKWNDGTDIPNIENQEEWAALETPALCAYDNDIETWAYTLP